MSACGDCMDKVSHKLYEFNAHIFHKFGHALNERKWRFVFVSLGLILGIIFCAGIGEIRFETNLDDLWIEKGTRVIGEKEFYEQYYGGFSRTEIVALLKKDRSNVATRESLDLLRDLTAPLLTNFTFRHTIGSTTRNLTTQNVCSRPQSPQLFSSQNATGITDWTQFTQWLAPPEFRISEIYGVTRANFAGAFAANLNCANEAISNSLSELMNDENCVLMTRLAQGTISSATVNLTACHYPTNTSIPVCCHPKYFRPWIMSGGERVYAVDNETGVVNPDLRTNFENWQGRDFEQFFWWYQYYAPTSTIETAQSTASSMTGLPFGWGIDEFPCTRANPLDCFEEGNYDFPDTIQILEPYMYGVSGLQFLDQSQNMITSYAADFTSSGMYAELQYSSTDVNARTAWTQCSRDIIDMMLLQPDDIPGKQYRYSVAEEFMVETIGESVVGLLCSIGYWWRFPYSGLTDDQIADRMNTAINNTDREEVDGKQCAASGMLLKMQTATGKTLTPTSYTWTDADGEVETVLDLAGQCCVAWAGTKLPAQLYSGGYPGTLEAFRIVLLTAHHDDPFFKTRLCEDTGLCDLSSEDREDILLDYEQYWIDTLEPLWEENAGGFESGGAHDSYHLRFFMQRSVTDMLEEATNLEVAIVVIGYLAIFGYSMSVNTSCGGDASNCVYSRTLITFIGVFIVLMSTIGSFGLFGWIGVPQSPLSATLVPFLSLGLGIDDMFVFLSSLVYYSDFQEDVNRRMVDTMGDSGPAVTVTSLANMAAFLIASLVELPAVQLFCWQMAFAIFTNWLYLMLIFTSLMYWNSVEVSKYQNCGVKTDKKEAGVVKSPLRDFAANQLAPLYVRVPFKITVLVAQATLLAVTIWLGFYKTEEGLALADVATKGTYVRDYLLVQFDYFFSYSVTMVTRDIPKYDAVPRYQPFQSNAVQFVNDTETNEFLSSTLPMSDLCGWNSLESFYEDSLGYPVPAIAYRRAMSIYFGTSGATQLENFVCKQGDNIVSCERLDEEDVDIVTSRCTGFTRDLTKHEDFVAMIKSLRKDADASLGNKYCSQYNLVTNGELVECDEFECSLHECYDAATNTYSDLNDSSLTPIYFYGFPFNFWEQYLNLETNLYKTVGFGILGVFGTTLTMQFSPRSSFLLAIMILSVCIQLYGLMYLIDVKRNAFSVVNLVLAIGAAVEFTSHVCHVFLINAGKDRNERMAITITELTAPLFNGGMTSFFSVIALAFSRFPFFKQYYFAMISIMILLCIWNGLVVLPVLLSLVGPPCVLPPEIQEEHKHRHSLSTKAAEQINKERAHSLGSRARSNEVPPDTEKLNDHEVTSTELDNAQI